MFDKNAYKELFRSYVFANRHASEAEALEYCHQIMPAQYIVANYWLIESSMQWFRWIKSQKTEPMLENEELDLVS